MFIASSQRQAYYREVESLSSGSTRKRISRTKLAEVELLLPKIPQQQRIAACFTALDTRIAAQASKLDALKTHERGLMQQLFPAPEYQ
jgi:type I restriction enzyme S subunit